MDRNRAARFALRGMVSNLKPKGMKKKMKKRCRDADAAQCQNLVPVAT